MTRSIRDLHKYSRCRDCAALGTCDRCFATDCDELVWGPVFEEPWHYDSAFVYAGTEWVTPQGDLIYHSSYLMPQNAVLVDPLSMAVLARFKFTARRTALYHHLTLFVAEKTKPACEACNGTGKYIPVFGVFLYDRCPRCQ